MDVTPVSLLERLRRPNDSDAWARLVAIVAPFLFEVARRHGLQDADAADVVQDVFGVLAQKLPSFRYDLKLSFRSWLRTVVLNRCRDRRRRTAAALVEQPTGLPLPDVAVADPLDVFAADEYRRVIATRALQLIQAEFSKATWSACWQQVVNDRPAAEVARELGITLNMAYLARSRVLARLRRELTGLWE